VTPETVPAPAVVAAPDATATPVGDATETPAVPAKRTPAKRVTRKPVSAERVAKAAAKLPGASVAAIAAKAEVSETTARRHLAALAADVTSPSAPLPAETQELIAA
jgi:hypothetical protein